MKNKCTYQLKTLKCLFSGKLCSLSYDVITNEWYLNSTQSTKIKITFTKNIVEI